MTKSETLREISKHGDVFVKLKDGKEHLVTADFSTKYIKEKKKKNKSAFYKMFKSTSRTNKLLLFNWSLNSFALLDTDNVISTTPLARVLQQ